jgi:hypothetical protein
MTSGLIVLVKWRDVKMAREGFFRLPDLTRSGQRFGMVQLGTGRQNKRLIILVIPTIGLHLVLGILGRVL